jgi:hypothetical protein
MKRIQAIEVYHRDRSNERVKAIDADDRALYAEEVRTSETIVGRIIQLENSQRALIDFPPNNSGQLVAARSLVPLKPEEIGREVALLFEDGELTKPIIVGVLPKDQAPLESTDTNNELDIKIDRETLVLTAKSEIVIRCGKASITLTKAGKVLLQGEYVVSRSAGVNKIRGGSVQIN